MMVADIVGGLMFGSIALVADGLHMSTQAGARLLAALAYAYARKHVDDQNFTFGAGRLAIVLAMIALLIASRRRFRSHCLGLPVNVANAWLLSGGGHHLGHGLGHAHGHALAADDDRHDHITRRLAPRTLLFATSANDPTDDSGVKRRART
jgi:Co/Zn/Cd efflux system component